MKFRDYWTKVRSPFLLLVRTLVIIGIFFVMIVVTGGILGAFAGLFPNYQILQNKDIAVLLAITVSGISVVAVVKLVDRKRKVATEHFNLRTQIWMVFVGSTFAIVFCVMFFLLTLLFSIVWDVFGRLFPNCGILQDGFLICAFLASICLACLVYLDTKKWRILQRVLQLSFLGGRKQEISEKSSAGSNSPQEGDE